MNANEQRELETTLQIQQAVDWIKTQFISEVDIAELPLDWAYAWVTALALLSHEYREIISEKIKSASIQEVASLSTMLAARERQELALSNREGRY